MEHETEPIRIEPEPVDYITSVVRGMAGAIPVAGGLVAELIGVVIPNQRMDRLTKFLRVLEERINKLDENYVRDQLWNEEFSDLLEEAARQAVHSLSDERREYISNLIGQSLADHDIKYSESKHLLNILNELNDIEIIWLRFYLHPTHAGDEEFRQTHANILAPVPLEIGASQAETEKSALQQSYKEHLARLGLLDEVYQTNSRLPIPQFDYAGRQLVRSFEITLLGKLLLKQIGMLDVL